MLYRAGIISGMAFISTTHYELRCVPTSGTTAGSARAVDSIFSETQRASMLPTIATRSLIIDNLGGLAGEFLDDRDRALGDTDYRVEVTKWTEFTYNVGFPAEAVRKKIYTNEVVPGETSINVLNTLADYENETRLNVRLKFTRNEESGPVYVVQEVVAAADSVGLDLPAIVEESQKLEREREQR